MTTKTQYALYTHEMLLHQVGERYQEEAVGCESQEIGFYETKAEALAALAAIKPSLSYEIIKTVSGLDSIQFDEAVVMMETVTVDEDGYEDLLDSETVATESGMPEEVRNAADKSMRSYWAYLDYEENGYIGVNDAM